MSTWNIAIGKTLSGLACSLVLTGPLLFGQTFTATAPIGIPPLVIGNASVINLYMASNWNTIAPPGLGETKEAIDSWTQALIASSYFTFASQYGLGTPRFGGGYQNSPSCSLPSSTNVVSTWNVGGFVNCNLTTSPLQDLINAGELPNVIVNVIMDPTLTMSDPTGATCTSAGAVSGYHSANQDVSTFLQPFTVVSAAPACNTNFNALTESLAHEMIEVMSDPIGMAGWVHRYGDNFNVAHSLAFGELGDICSSIGPKATSSGGFIGFLGTPATPASAAFYWSNSAQACVPTWPTTHPSLASNPVTIGEGVGTIMISISGTGFGDAFSDLQSSAIFPNLSVRSQSMPYFLLSDLSQGTKNGNSLDSGGDSNPFSWTWSDTSVTVQIPVAKFFSCDALQYTIWNPSDGSSVQGSATLPGPAIIGVEFPQKMPVGAATPVTVFASPQAGVVLSTPTQMTLQVDGGTPQQILVPGQLSVPVTFSSIGTHTVSVNTTSCNPPLSSSSTVTALPSLTGIDPDHGPATGGSFAAKAVSIFGNGLLNTTAVLFGSQNAQPLGGSPGFNSTDQEVGAEAPDSTPGRVPVSVVANGMDSTYADPKNPIEYWFENPGIPLLNRTLSTCSSDFIEIRAWGQPQILGNSAPLANAPISFSTTNAVLGVPLIHTLDSNGAGQITAVQAKGTGPSTVTATLATGSATIDVLSPGDCIWWGLPASEISPFSVIQQLHDCAACAFPDVPVTPANMYIYEDVAWGLMSGIGNKFQPKALLTAAQLVSSVQRIAGPRAEFAYQQVFRSGKNNMREQDKLTYSRALAFLDMALQRKRSHSIERSRPFTRADLARVLWLYAKEATEQSNGEKRSVPVRKPVRNGSKRGLLPNSPR